MSEKDILILGSGPSGLSTTLHLIPSILILEKEHYPRFKLRAGKIVSTPIMENGKTHRPDRRLGIRFELEQKN